MKSKRSQAARTGASARRGLWIGTSGWTYDSWRGPFYPQDVPKKNWLSWYTQHFVTTEINGSFYRTPSLEAVQCWHDNSPDEFIFAWKASKFITHWKRLSEKSDNSIELMETRLKVLGRKVGPVLFQLPPRFELNEQRLANFLKMLPRRYDYTFEFRHPSWYTDSVFKLLEKHQIALCISDHHHAPSPWLATAPHVYVRGHGPTGRYRDNYPDEMLRKWVRKIRAWRREGRTVYVYFDNDTKSAAPQDAERLLKMLVRRGSGEPAG